MKRKYIESSAIKTFGYNTEDQILEIEFHDNAVWQYMHVPEKLFAKFLKASSKGNFFVTCIKGKFSEKRMNAAELKF